ncbi:MAG: hypothetical protein COB14_09495 [Alphaproteobacteria bacterium]|nr:MAG: hypothetical protein COB14_09495 [Alphaproteobacteria bacterium]
MTHKLLATSLLAACLATTSLISVNVMANDPELYFYPKDKWTVERIDNNQPLQSCVLSNQLNNGYIIQLAGTESGFTNLNIDFRQDSFEKNKKYEVKYSVPGIIEKVIPTKAFKKSLLVSDLRHDGAFAEALSTTSVLDVQIRDTQFRLYMTGLEASLPEYTECITPQTTMAATKIEDTPTPIFSEPEVNISGNIAPPPPILSISSDSSAENAAQQSGAVSMDIPAHQLRPEPSNKPRYTEELAKQLKEESEKYKPAKQQTPASEPEALAHTNDAPDTLLTATEPTPQVVENNVARTHTSEKAKSSKPVYHVKKLEPISVDFTNAAPQKQSPTTIASAAMPAQKDDGAQFFADIEPASGAQNTDFVTMRNKLSDLEQRIGTLLRKNRLLDDELKNTLHDAQSERLSVSSDNWNLERATIKFNESERQIMRMGRQLQTQKAQCQQEKTELENMLFDPELTNQQQLASLASLENELDTAKSDFYRQQRQYEERIRLLEKQLNAQ